MLHTIQHSCSPPISPVSLLPCKACVNACRNSPAAHAWKKLHPFSWDDSQPPPSDAAAIHILQPPSPAQHSSCLLSAILHSICHLQPPHRHGYSTFHRPAQTLYAEDDAVAPYSVNIEHPSQRVTSNHHQLLIFQQKFRSKPASVSSCCCAFQATYSHPSHCRLHSPPPVCKARQPPCLRTPLVQSRQPQSRQTPSLVLAAAVHLHCCAKQHICQSSCLPAL